MAREGVCQRHRPTPLTHPRELTVILHLPALSVSYRSRHGSPTIAPRPPRARLHRVSFPCCPPRRLRCTTPLRNPASFLSCFAPDAWMIQVPQTISSYSAPGKSRTVTGGRGAAGPISAAVLPPIAPYSPSFLLSPGVLRRALHSNPPCLLEQSWPTPRGPCEKLEDWTPVRLGSRGSRTSSPVASRSVSSPVPCKRPGE